MPLTENRRAYVASNFALVLDENSNNADDGGWLFSVEGGMAQAEVVNEKIGPEHLNRKHLSAVKYDDITVTCGAAMSRKFFDWVNQSFERNDYDRRNGSIIAADFNLREVTRLNFYNALVTEVGFPALDAASRESMRLSVKFTPEYTRFLRGKGESITNPPFPTRSINSKRWLVRNFRCTIDPNGKSIDCSRVAKVEAIAIKQKVTEVPLGEFREPYREPTMIEYPNVVFTLPESHADGFFDWYQTFVVEGRCSDSEEKNGSIEFFHEDMKTLAARIDLYHLGLFKITPDKGDAGSDKIRMVKVEMYCEQMKFDIKEAYI